MVFRAVISRLVVPFGANNWGITVFPFLAITISYRPTQFTINNECRFGFQCLWPHWGTVSSKPGAMCRTLHPCCYWLALSSFFPRVSQLTSAHPSEGGPFSAPGLPQLLVWFTQKLLALSVWVKGPSIFAASLMIKLHKPKCNIGTNRLKIWSSSGCVTQHHRLYMHKHD